MTLQPTAIRILVVEDDAFFRALLEEQLREAGHAVSMATTGLEALERIGREGVRYDLVITDILMPDMDGLQLIRLLKRRPDPPRILVVSGGSFRIPRDFLPDAASLGADACLRKPYDPEELFGAMADALRADTAQSAQSLGADDAL